MPLNVLAATMAAAIVALVVLVALCGWAGRVPRWQRVGLCLIAAGVLWAGPGRLQGAPVSLGDLLMLLGVLVYGLSVYGRQLRDHVDQLDGLKDGRFFTTGAPTNGVVHYLPTRKRPPVR